MNDRILLTSTFFSLLIPAQAQPGTLDPTFGNGGSVIHSFAAGTDMARAVTVQPDGRILVAGYEQYNPLAPVIVARFNSDGTLDPTFGNGGWATASYASNYSGITYGMVLQPDGRIVTAGYVATDVDNDDFCAARFNSDGTLDATFGGDGLVHYGFSENGDHAAHAIALQADGRIVLAGHADLDLDEHIGVMRLNTDGTLDTDFDGDGRVAIELNEERSVEAIAIRSDGRIVLVGTADYTSGFVTQLNSDGSLDTGFGTGGTTLVNMGGQFEGWAVAIQADGKVLVGGNTYGWDQNYALARLNQDGSFDTSFGTGGSVISGFSNIPYNDYGRCLLVQPDGRILLGGATSENSDNAFGVMRFNSDGSLDNGFDGDGQVIHNIVSGYADQPYAMAFQPDGKVVCAGLATSDTGVDFAIIRMNGGGGGTGVEEHAGAGVALWPNPTTGGLNIVPDATWTGATITVFDALGQECVRQAMNSGSRMQVELNGPAGVYFVQLRAPGRTSEVVRVIKE